MTLATDPTAPAAETFASLNPRTGEPVASFPVHGAPDVEAALARARPAQRWWWDLGFAERRRRLFALRGMLARRAPELAELIRTENGKPVLAAHVEICVACEHLTFAARHAERVLGPRRVRPGALTLNHTSSLAYEPLGVVGLITPWNYPLLVPAADLGAALAAGNAVLMKPSELTPAIARWLVDRVAEAVPEQPVVQLLTGDGETGAALCASGVDKIGFTGSAATGRKIMAACADTLTPVTLELGGKDPLIVDADGDLDQAARAAAYGALWNTGQTCISLERAYVHEQVYDAFLARLAAHVEQVGDRLAHSVGPMSTHDQLEIVREHVDDALERGARAVIGGPESFRPPFIDPIVLVDVPEDARIMTEETFGPTLPVFPVRDADEALERANASAFALGGTIIARRRATELARRLHAGACTVNGTLAFYAHGRLPFGGGGGVSGFGSVHGAEGLRGFAHPKSVTRQRFDLTRFWPDKLDIDPRADRLLPWFTRTVYGRR